MTSLATAPALTGSFTTVMNNLVAMENRVHDDLRVYMWKPATPEPPFIYNTIPSAPFGIMDQGRWRDRMTVVATLAVRHTDVEIEMARLLTYVDAFRAVVDQELYARRPLGSVKAARQGMNTSNPIFGGVSYQAFDFPMLIEIDRNISPQ